MQQNTPLSMDNRIKGHGGLGLIQLFEGHGKGKTTAALGEAIRAVGAGLRVAIVYFDKGGTHYCERNAVARYLSEVIQIYGTGRDRICPQTGRFDFSITEQDKQEGARGLQIAQTLFTNGDHQLVILDEINSSADLGIVSVEEVLSVLSHKLPQTEVILTGRNAPEALKARAHLITEMQLQKHYFYSGVAAREGVDY